MPTHPVVRGLILTALALGAPAAASVTPVPPVPPHTVAPVELRVPVPPTPVVAGGRTHLVYELRIANFDKQRRRELRITRLDVLGDAGTPPLASYEGDSLSRLLVRPAVTPAPADPRRLACGEQTVAFLWITLEAGQRPPARLRHRVEVTSEGWKHGLEAEGAAVALPATPPVALAPPLRGGGWMSANGPSNGTEADEHRRALNVVDGAARIPQRFAVDWVRFGENGRLLHDDAGKNANWWSYGADVLAVADASIVELRDGIPDNAPGSAAVAITLETLGGNYLALDLGGGRYAAYFHLQPGSLLVRPGDRVRQGQVLARVGNSGLSDGPHLHFQVTDGPSPLASEGLPFVLRRFRRLGTFHAPDDPTQAVFVPAGQPASKEMEMPLEDDVLDFER